MKMNRSNPPTAANKRVKKIPKRPRRELRPLENDTAALRPFATIRPNPDKTGIIDFLLSALSNTVKSLWRRSGLKKLGNLTT